MNNLPQPFNQGQQLYSAYQQMQQMFPQPQGSVYQINALTEIGNVPIGSTGLSVAICFTENIMYIKSFQNGSPVIMAYRIAPYTKEQPAELAAGAKQSPSVEDRLARIEQLLATQTEEGGKFNGLL